MDNIVVFLVASEDKWYWGPTAATRDASLFWTLIRWATSCAVCKLARYY